MPARSLVIAALRFYQRAVSPYLGPCCRFAPSCSEYAIQSISMNGLMIGLFDGMATGDAYDVQWIPAAVKINPDGTIGASVANTAEDIRKLISA